MTSHEADAVLAVVVTGGLTFSSVLNAPLTGWRRWATALVMLSAFGPAIAPSMDVGFLPTSIQRALLAAAFALWVLALAVEPQRRLWLRRLAILACGTCIVFVELQ